MSGAVVKDMELREPDEYAEFNPMNPGNSAPMVAWLASDEALHVTGQVFRAVGSTIAHYRPWALGDEMEMPPTVVTRIRFRPSGASAVTESCGSQRRPAK